MSEISRKIIKPKDCVLAFGIPTSREGFYHQKHTSVNSEFVRNFVSWSKYERQIVSYISRIKPAMTRLGATVVHDLTLQSYEQLFFDRRFDVVILFSHWKDDAIEFYNGLADTQSIINSIPPDFSGILDLCVCHPDPLTIALRKCRPNCLVRYIPKKATPSLWLYFYLILFKYLHEEDNIYSQALEKTVDAFFTLEKR